MPGRTAAFACVERLADEPVLLRDQLGVLGHGLAGDEGACHVRPAAARLVARPEIDVDRQSRGERTATRLVPVALPDRRDDHIGRARRSMRGARLAQNEANVLGEEQLAVHLEAAFGSGLGTSEQLGRCGHPRLGGPLCDSDALELDRRLRAPPQLDCCIVDGQDDPVLAQAVAEPQRKVGRDDRLADADLPHGAELDLTARFVHRQAALDELLVAELEVVQQLGVGQLTLYAVRLEARSQDVQSPVDLGVEQRIADRDRNLVPQRGGTLCVPGE